MYLMILIIAHLGRPDMVQVLDRYPTWAKCEHRVPAMRQKLPSNGDAFCIPVNRYVH